MLTSITPLGERGRGSHWGATVAFLVVGSLLGGLAVGAGLGTVGSALGLDAIEVNARAVVLAVALAVGLALDLRLGGLHLPSTRRQVNENWIGAFRGWVYGAGFGLQLGAGLLTVVTTAAVYLTFLVCLIAATVPTGALIGGLFGLLRGLTVLPARAAVDPVSLARLGHRLGELEPRVRIGTSVGLGASLAIVVSLLVVSG